MKTKRRGSEDAVATGERPLVSVIDDDESVRESLPDLLREFGFAARAFYSAEDSLCRLCQSEPMSDPRCQNAGHVRPGSATGTEAAPARDPDHLYYRHAEETVRSRLLERGASACLFKPFGDTALREALNAALGVS